MVRRDHSGMQLAEGLILDGHYRLRQLLGRGGMGEVWEAEHTRLPKLFAIKFLLDLAGTDTEMLMRFRREAEIASRLNHPSIVAVTDFNTLPDGTAYIVMERLVGEDLRARLERAGPLPLAEAREITRQVGSALQLAHREGIVHRDLKPENIFLCREPDGSLRAKVLDFGISKLQGNLASTRDDRVLGTPGYMAPEQAMGKNSSIDGRTDLFALASIVFEMLSGQGAFEGETLAELCTKVLYHEPPALDALVPAVPRTVAAAVSQALSKEPAARHAEIRLFTDAIAGATEAPVVTSGYAATIVSETRPIPSFAVRMREELKAGSTQALDTPAPQPQPTAAVESARRGLARGVLAGAAAAVVLVSATAWLTQSHAKTGTSQAAERDQARTEARVALAKIARSDPQPAPTQLAASSGNDQTARNTELDSAAQASPSSAPAAQAPAGVSAAPANGAPAHAANATDAPAHATNASAGIGQKPTTRPSTRAETPLSPEAQAALGDAEAALARGDTAGAIRLARNSLRSGENSRAYATMARAYCKQRDLGMVKAMLRNLSAAEKKQVRKDCLASGMNLD